ncbi:purine nucleoside phosphorylase I, inosine and guanosine-specific [Bacillus atrophaeus]|uniref:purine nucleoside phosphorylase I, inosine and guanosine-specific n=1 Tax=Bacillus atrophaeus TaxID=1452 RepID=UPI000B927B03|nr:purine nucleoside phosphorylase I, inosine and guanosine-specific [Bacillus atrophaeus]ASS71735.1 purine-nucleoside phosphorylase [Bacillus atrophaeus]ATO28424.1 purine nucleoside phosphorylase I, inosine and guanosine-specific [Bacillus atrophaeus]MBJ7896794.1 purine nucleoside phosphorylase I, inosine and guanosine-specific [Bacillus atrophaeus]MCY8465306.1 purine nucleoside phosphorylase I, inosine and guanosine-specific [Bacillus atrophaeus]MCY8478468.1 purine nucleoside phosphorylase I
MKQKIEQAAAFIKQHAPQSPKIGLILGSGLGILADEIEGAVKLKYEDIPDFPVSTVEGHAGQLVFGTLEGVSVVAMQGRFHFYEGYSMDKVTFPVRVMKELGVEALIVTNAAGGINTAFRAGDLMIITDHINYMGTNPLIGPNEADFGVRFPDMSSAYDKDLSQLAEKMAQELQIPVQKGVYTAVTGPSYETPAEVRFLRTIGSDAVGMSTVPEVIVAKHAGLRVLGISCISNAAAGILDQPLSHDEVMEVTEKVKAGFLQLVKAVIAKYK